MKHRVYITIAGLLLSTATTFTPAAIASDYTESDVRSETYCYPVKHAFKAITQTAKVKAEQRDVVDIKIMPRFLIYDDGELPERYYIVDKADTIDFTINEDGSVPDFVEKVIESPKSSDLCIDDSARVGLASDDESLYFEMGLTPFFNNKSGRHSLSELNEGTKDGKVHYKAMIPAPVRAFMPETDYFHVKYDARDTVPEIYAETADGLTHINSEFFNEGHVISLKSLIDVDATALVIKGGNYKLAPVPSIKTMKRFGVGRPRGPKAAQEASH